MIIYGKNTVLEALKGNKDIVKIYVTSNNLDLVKKYTSNKKIEIIVMQSKDMNKMFDGNHQGIACEIMEYGYVSIDEIIRKNKDKENVALVILDGLEDPHNLGAILRTADATGMNGVIIPKNRSVSLNSTVAKVSTGAIEHVDCAQVTNLVNAMNDLKKAGYWIVGLELDGSIDYRKQDYLGKIAVVIGSEGKGISRLVKENCDFKVFIPMVGHVNSLNASVSASILFYEILRNRG
ncbi:MAG: 23S rRNA (guanosine(2251)-2'-O)-methyltransferase RlmB [Bacilli bacterium]|nr:23S rRNA (guanosine(2251)-2'-O)-methyltransferase RlmB [Bacilli bacterium]